MSNADARPARTLPPPRGKPFGVGGETRPSENGIRRLLLAAVLFAGDLVSGATTIVAAVIIAAAAGEMDLVGRMQAQAGLLLLLLLGINCSLGLYRPNVSSPMERFRLRVSATLLFVFAGMLMWIRTGSWVELAVVPMVGAIAPI